MMRMIPGDGSWWVSTSLDALVVATPVSLALAARWCFTGASRETPALVSARVSLPSCRCYSWPSGTAGGSGRLQGGDQTVDGLGVWCEGIRGSIAPRVGRLAADRDVSVERSIHGGECAPWDKSAITRRRRTSSQSNRRFFGRRLAARAALSASSARYCPSGPEWRAISRHTTEGLRPIKWTTRVLDKPTFTPAMIAARSQAPSIRRHPMISL